MEELTQKQILINQVLTDLGEVKKDVYEHGFCDEANIDRLIRKVEDVKEIEDKEVELVKKTMAKIEAEEIMEERPDDLEERLE